MRNSSDRPKGPLLSGSCYIQMKPDAVNMRQQFFGVPFINKYCNDFAVVLDSKVFHVLVILCGVVLSRGPFLSEFYGYDKKKIMSNICRLVLPVS